MKYYSIKNIFNKKAVYNVIIGERYSGRIYSKLELLKRTGEINNKEFKKYVNKLFHNFGEVDEK